MIPNGLDALGDLRVPLEDLGQLWAKSIKRPRPAPVILDKWDSFLERWLSSNLPLILRDSSRRGESTATESGRSLLFGDNTPANWALGLALSGEVPDLTSWTPENIRDYVPLSFINRGGFKRDLNRYGWKVCHIESVSDRKRYKVEAASLETIRARFIRFMSPRNMFLIPKIISGAGELAEIISAIDEYERNYENDGSLST